MHASEQLDSEGIKQQLKDATLAAKELRMFGVPSFIVNKQLVWGSDRFDHIRWLLKKETVKPKSGKPSISRSKPHTHTHTTVIMNAYGRFSIVEVPGILGRWNCLGNPFGEPKGVHFLSWGA